MKSLDEVMILPYGEVKIGSEYGDDGAIASYGDINAKLALGGLVGALGDPNGPANVVKTFEPSLKDVDPTKLALGIADGGEHAVGELSYEA